VANLRGVGAIDAYAPALSLDGATLPAAASAPVRLAILDSNNDGKFDDTDLDTFAECNNQQQCVPGIDDKIRLDVAVGDGIPDQCAAGQANVVLTVPVETLVWIDETMPMTCPAADGEYNPETDQLLSRIEQIFDFTTDTNTVDWADLSGDGCTIAHTDPPIRFSNSGTCWDIAGQTMTIAASGALGSASAPLYDTSFTAFFPSTVSAPAPPSGASCDAPPPIDFAGTTVRCLE